MRTMPKFRSLLLMGVLGCLMPCLGRAHDTNPPLTRLEAFETQTGTVIIKGTGQIGALSASTASVSVRCRESIDFRTGRREYGVLIVIKEGNRDEDTSFLDYDELDPLLAGMDYIGRADYSVTDLPTFAVGYTTRDQLKISVYSSNKNPGTIQPTLQTRREERVRVLLAAEQLAQLRTLIHQAKGKLDSLRASRPM